MIEELNKDLWFENLESEFKENSSCPTVISSNSCPTLMQMQCFCARDSCPCHGLNCLCNPSIGIA